MKSSDAYFAFLAWIRYQKTPARKPDVEESANRATRKRGDRCTSRRWLTVRTMNIGNGFTKATLIVVKAAGIGIGIVTDKIARIAFGLLKSGQIYSPKLPFPPAQVSNFFRESMGSSMLVCKIFLA